MRFQRTLHTSKWPLNHIFGTGLSQTRHFISFAVTNHGMIVSTQLMRKLSLSDGGLRVALNATSSHRARKGAQSANCRRISTITPQKLTVLSTAWLNCKNHLMFKRLQLSQRHMAGYAACYPRFVVMAMCLRPSHRSTCTFIAQLSRSTIASHGSKRGECVKKLALKHSQCQLMLVMTTTSTCSAFGKFIQLFMG